MYGRSFSDDESTVGGADGGPPREYVFEGFNIEFSKKLILTPLVPRSSLAATQSRARAFVLEPKESKHNEIPKAEFDRLNLDSDRFDARQRIMELAAGSALAGFDWPGHGVAPIAYIKGMAVVFTKVLCKFRNGDPGAVEMAKASTGNPDRDALARFAPQFTALGMANNVAGEDTLRHLFVLLIGLGIRESDGKYCVGRDPGGGNFGADTAEAGLFQTSLVAGGQSPLMQQIFQQHRANPDGLLEIFRKGVSCRPEDAQTFGVGDGAEFQKLSKASPLFAAEFAAVGLRSNCLHWGPILNLTVNIRREADEMLQQVQNLINANNMCPLMLN